MIKKVWGNIMLFHYGNCKNELYDLKQLKELQAKKIGQLEGEVISLLGRIEEAKAVYNYQVSELESEIERLKVPPKVEPVKADTPSFQRAQHLPQDVAKRRTSKK